MFLGIFMREFSTRAREIPHRFWTLWCCRFLVTFASIAWRYNEWHRWLLMVVDGCHGDLLAPLSMKSPRKLWWPICMRIFLRGKRWMGLRRSAPELIFGTAPFWDAFKCRTERTYVELVTSNSSNCSKHYIGSHKLVCIKNAGCRPLLDSPRKQNVHISICHRQDG